MADRSPFRLRFTTEPLVEGDAESTARRVAWPQWYATPVGDRDEAHYAALEVLSADENGTLA